MAQKRRSIVLSVLLIIAMAALTACGSGKSADTAGSPDGSVATAAVKDDGANKQTDAPKTKKKIKFYGNISEYPSGQLMVDELGVELKDKYDFEFITVDWGNLEKVIRTGIAANDPADIYIFPSGGMKPFVDAGMVYDLTPAMEANGGEWKNIYNASTLESGTYNGKIYNAPFEANFSTIIANAELFEQAGVAIPTAWNWEQFLAALKQIQDKTGVYPFANATDLARADWILRNGIDSLAVSQGKEKEINDGTMEFTSPLFTTVFQNVKDLYGKNYMYPGKGAATVKNDEIKAGFYQGKVAMMAEIAAGAKATLAGAKFKTVVLPWPAMGEKNAVLGGFNGFFVPSNSNNKEDAAEILKVFMSEKIQSIHAGVGNIPANKNVKITDPIVQGIASQSSLVSSVAFGSTSAKPMPKITDYFANQATAQLVLGKGVEAAQKDLEALRSAALK
ncbi:unnamed protein product [Aphanomyces euteiches]